MVEDNNANVITDMTKAPRNAFIWIFQGRIKE